MDENQRYLKKYGSVIPCRARLSHESMFAPTQEQRDAANALLKLLPEPDPNKPVPWAESAWNPVNAPYYTAWEQSPAGKLTLEMIRNSSVDGRKGDETPMVNAAAPESPVTNASPPAIEDDGINEHLKRLDWPPRPSPPPPKPPEDDDMPHKWQAARPSTPDKSLRPLPPDENFSNNDPIY
jgi:hypothetical protein